MLTNIPGKALFFLNCDQHGIIYPYRPGIPEDDGDRQLPSLSSIFNIIRPDYTHGIDPG